MLLKRLSLAGYMGVSPQKPLEITFAEQITFLIGPNNSGKSVVLRFLHFLFPKLGGDTFQVVFNLSDFNQWDVWRTDESVQVIGHITFEVGLAARADVGDLPPPHIMHENEIHASIEVLKALGSNIWNLFVIPEFYVRDCWKAVHRRQFVNNAGWQLQPIDAAENKDNKSSELLRKWQSCLTRTIGPTPLGAAGVAMMQGQPGLRYDEMASFHFFDTVRALDRQGRRGMNDGSQLLADLWNWQSSGALALTWRDFKRRLISQLNSIFAGAAIPKVHDVEMKGPSQGGAAFAGAGSPIMQLTFGSEGVPIPLEEMGTGVSQLVILLSALIRQRRKPCVVFVEEPETNLHPGLLRRFVKVLRTFENVQIVITTHSNALLDSIDEKDRVYHFRQDEDGACLARPCQLRTEQHALLDSLGVSAGTILQANAVVWVEGPSDRLYLREWINRTDPELTEGSDYSFGFYGGKVLSHFSLESQEESDEQLIDLLAVCRFSVVLMDRDLPPGSPLDMLNKTKKRIREEAERDKTHRRACVSNGREVENDVLPSEALLRGAAAVLGKKYDDLKDAKMTGEEPYEEEIISHLGLSGDAAKPIRRKLSNKVALARCVLKECSSHGGLTPPGYVAEIVDLIKQARVLEPA